MGNIIPFAQLNKGDISSAGGKGANLGELSAAGFPVPAGFVLTTAAYDEFVRRNGLRAQILALVAGVNASSPQSVARVSDEINMLFMQGAITPQLAAEITGAYQTLTRRESGTSAGDAVAVRSSATAEDLPTASFAGQQDTFLNIRGEQALLEAVKKCWASLWTARAVAYRRRQGIEPAAVSLAVIVQRMVAADVAGILFTANPINGQRDQLLINAAWGLGEAIVGGQVTPDTIIVDKQRNVIHARETAAKAVMTVRSEAGTEARPVPQTQQNQPALDDALALELSRIGAQIEAHYSMPMDIEWALANGEITILQARQITSLPDPPPAELEAVTWEPVVPKTIWMRRQIVEHMPAPLSPLFEDLYVRQGLDRSIKTLLEAMGEIGGATLDLDAMMPHGFAGTINGYAYTTGSFRMNWQNLIATLKVYRRIFKFTKMSAFDWEGVVLPQYQALIARWRSVDLAVATDEELLRGISDMAAADSAYWFGSAVNLGLSRIMDTVFNRLLASPLVRYALTDPRPVSATFLRGFDSKVLDAQADLEAIGASIRASADLRAFALATDARELPEALKAHPDGESAAAGIRHYLAQYGHQIYNLDFVDPTQIEEPLPMLLSLKALVEHAPEQDVRTRQARLAKEREALVSETMRRLNPLSRCLFRWVWKWTKHYAPYRENVMFYVGAAWPTVRKMAVELGQRLADAGTIAEPGDIYYLDSREICEAIDARSRQRQISGFVERVDARRALRTARKRLTPPAKVPERSRMQFGPLDLSMFDPTPTDAADMGPVLQGYAVSTGRVTAPASVIRSVEEFEQMQPGTILVCTTTTPAWTPLFSQALGLVTDVGGALAHGSIVAREYGIPAVMGTGVATERIKPGMMITVDGDAGTVTPVEPG